MKVVARRRSGYTHDVEIEGGHTLVIDEPAAAGGGFALPLTARRLERAPSFPPDAWPDFDDRGALAVVHAYFGVPPEPA